jgi:hypothetical protein
VSLKKLSFAWCVDPSICTASAVALLRHVSYRNAGLLLYAGLVDRRLLGLRNDNIVKVNMGHFRKREHSAAPYAPRLIGK